MYEIYITTNKVNNKKYIGQHKITKEKDYYLGSGKILKDAIKKYGRNNFDKKTLCLCETKEEANNQERYYINLYEADTNPQFYNLAKGGDGGGFEYYAKYLKEHPEEAERIKEKRLIGTRKWQENNKEKMVELGKRNIVKCHQWMRENPESLKLNGNPEALKLWMNEHPEEAQANRDKGRNAIAQWNKDHPEEQQRNLALGPQANKEKNGKKIICLNNGKIFASIREAEEYYHTYKDAIGRCLRGQLKTAGKDPETGERLRWKILKE